MTDKKRGLGRSLGDLLGSSEWLRRNDIQLFYCPIDRLQPNPYQPRKILDDAQLQELAASIKEKGVLQPILVTRTEVQDHYQIVAGERRWQAARLADLAEVPVILREATSPEALELALIENIQRRDLNCIEEASAYQRLQDEFHLTQEEIASRVGKNRSTVANLLRLLQLPPPIQEDVLNERLTMGHARALLSISDPDERMRVRDLIIGRNLSVRQAEQLVARTREPRPPRLPVEPHVQEIQDRLQSLLGTRVNLRRRGQKGSLTIAFGSDDQLQAILQRLGLES